MESNFKDKRQNSSYFGVDLSIVWDIVTEDIPVLKEKLDRIIEKEGWKNEANNKKGCLR